MCVDGSVGHDTHKVFYEFGPTELVDLKLVDSVSVTTLMENVYDLFMPSQGPAARAKRYSDPAVPCAVMREGEVPDGLVAEHGSSFLLTISTGGTAHRLLFDAGTSPNGVIDNMRRLDVDPTEIEAIVCSHGHYDHVAGLAGILRTLGTKRMPMVIHPDFWNERRLVFDTGETTYLPTPSKTFIRESNVEVLEGRRPGFLFNGSVLITGEVPRVTGYEPGFPPQQARHDGSWVPDPLVLDEQAVILNVRGKGLVVITGCGHAGVVNICRYARQLTGGEPIYAIMGGFHLNGPTFEPLIPWVVSDLAALEPSFVVPGHCTGWRAQHAIAAQFRDAFIPNCVGTRFSF